MAHYAFLDENNIVTEVIVGVEENELLEGLDPETWYGNFRGQVCKRTSYNTSFGEHSNNGTPFRKNFASIGFTYDSERDAFIEPKPFPSWILNESTCRYDAPYPRPDRDHFWREDLQQWVRIGE